MLTDNFLKHATENLPVVHRVINEYGDSSLTSYLETLRSHPSQTAQPQDDLMEVVGDYTRSLLGEAAAGRIVDTLSSNPVALTTNHHGIDYFAQSIQGTLIFILSKIVSSNGQGTVPVPVFSCGGVPLNNLSYPQGFLLYHLSPKHPNGTPQKLQLFSNKHRRQLVSAAGPINKDMVERAKKRVEAMQKDDIVEPSVGEALSQILSEDYSDTEVMGLPNYSQQAVILNNRIWKRIFSKCGKNIETIHLELEVMAGQLLKKDLSDRDSLAWQVMFDPELRDRVIRALDGIVGCWDVERLKDRMGINASREKQNSKSNGSGTGTIFFWGIDKKGKRFPLYLFESDHNDTLLRGIDDRGTVWEYDFTPNSLVEALTEGRILSSLFTLFLVISFARGLVCVGGYYQGVYLPQIQKGLVNALEANGYRDIAQCVSQVSTSAYLSGMLAVMTQKSDDQLIPSGPLEIVAGGGLAEEDIEKMGAMTVRDAHIAALVETVMDFDPQAFQHPEQKESLAKECADLMSDKIVIK